MSEDILGLLAALGILLFCTPIGWGIIALVLYGIIKSLINFLSNLDFLPRRRRYKYRRRHMSKEDIHKEVLEALKES
jgi:hypothetical protein